MEFSSLVVSAPAKVILHGEHAVVYGKVSLAASVGLRTTLTWEKLKNDKVELHLHDLGYSSSWTVSQLKDLQLFPTIDVDAFKIFLGSEMKQISDIAFTAVWAFVYLYRSIYGKSSSLEPGKFVLKSDIPVGAGLGSSASYCTVLATALLITSGAFTPDVIVAQSHDTSRDEILRMISNWAYEAEKIIHGKPSGIDNTVSTFGGFLQFQSGQMENIRRVPELNIFLVNTNVPRSTKTMVSGLRQRYEEMPNVYDHMFNAINEISVECRRILEQIGEEGSTAEDSDHFLRLQKLVDLNQDILRTVGVSHAVIDKVCETTLANGFHSKLTGAGGGGCVITLLKQDTNLDMLQKLSEELKALGCDSWKTKLGGDGVTVHEWTVDKNIKHP